MQFCAQMQADVDNRMLKNQPVSIDWKRPVKKQLEM